ncbi:Protein phosphatase 1 regulatory subunit 12A [Collichthys lucidus]|uniref:Protein phosphatase 1 regulatory subunit 12A n=1 Tax=Collichthys lucidus TaxID=240159 RepID=A0A4U5VQU1_COLLU|nr:Protein phosphatase 1 regulatory subunit 12A [Collichthys lucidus]
MADAKQKRNEQLKRWLGSETDLEPPVLKKKKTKVKFDDGAVFLAACSSGDTEEVLRMLDRGADINYANVDGLTALHQVGAPRLLYTVCFTVCQPAPASFISAEEHLSNGSHSHPPVVVVVVVVYLTFLAPTLLTPPVLFDAVVSTYMSLTPFKKQH